MFDSYRLYLSLWKLLNAIGGEGTVDVVAEVLVIEHEFWITGLVVISK